MSSGPGCRGAVLQSGGGVEPLQLTRAVLCACVCFCACRELRQYLDEGGVLDAWSKCLVP